MSKYKVEVSINGTYCNGNIEVEASNANDAYDKALAYVGKKLYEAFPSLDIEYNVEVLPKTVVVTDIEWDTDGEDVDLPTEVTLEDIYYDEDVYDDAIEDRLSDEYEFCVKSFKVKEVIS